ncbi:MAG: ribonuclease HII [Epsilonproteobacteria bacterium]|nr:ribonuclease HII [Campylobacterota bacterium]
MKQSKITANYFEHDAWKNNAYVCGLDEVGRGCLAGPVVVGAAILPVNTTSNLLKDSKVLDGKKREEAFVWINKHCLWTTVSLDHHIIDHLNIYQATLRAMKQATVQLMAQLPFCKDRLKYIVTDAMPLKLPQVFMHEKLELHHFTNGEKYSTSIAAASIVAKVTRDRLMERMDKHFPQFGFASHKGYATKKHLASINTHGPLIIHRKSFLKKVITIKADHGQQCLF